jgi:hypothetical protein
MMEFWDVRSRFFEFLNFPLEACVAYREQVPPEGDQNRTGCAMVSGIESKKNRKPSPGNNRE